jgi:hypothetical protein
MKADKEGVLALSKLISPAYDIKDARGLDVYASNEKFPKLKVQVPSVAHGMTKVK